MKKKEIQVVAQPLILYSWRFWKEKGRRKMRWERRKRRRKEWFKRSQADKKIQSLFSPFYQAECGQSLEETMVCLWANSSVNSALNLVRQTLLHCYLHARYAGCLHVHGCVCERALCARAHLSWFLCSSLRIVRHRAGCNVDTPSTSHGSIFSQSLFCQLSQVCPTCEHKE